MRVIQIATIFGLLTLKIEAAVPSIFKICGRDELELNSCLKLAIQDALKSLKDEYKDDTFRIPSIDPIVEKDFKFEYIRNQINARAHLKNFKSYGLINGKVQNVRANLQDDHMDLEIDMTLKKLFVDGFFKGEGRLNTIVLNTEAYYNNTMHDLKWTWKISGSLEEKDGKGYMIIKRFFMRPEVRHMEVNLPVIFEDNPTLDKFARDFAQRYWRLIYHELLPIFEKVFDKIGTKYLNRIFAKVPYDELFPPLF